MQKSFKHIITIITVLALMLTTSSVAFASDNTSDVQPRATQVGYRALYNIAAHTDNKADFPNNINTYFQIQSYPATTMSYKIITSTGATGTMNIQIRDGSGLSYNNFTLKADGQTHTLDLQHDLKIGTWHIIYSSVTVDISSVKLYFYK